jgi:DNA-directed RNA polymerase, mitochondrial
VTTFSVTLCQPLTSRQGNLEQSENISLKYSYSPTIGYPERDNLENTLKGINPMIYKLERAMTILQADPNDDLMTIQIRLEEEMTQRGQERYLRDVSKAKNAQREEGTAYGQTILSHRLDGLAKGIQAWIQETSKGVAGNRNLAYKKVKDMDPNTLAFLTLKNILAGISSLRTVQFVGRAIGTAIEDELRFAAVRKIEKKKFEKIVEGAKKRSSYHYKHIYAVRQAQRVDSWERWTAMDRVHVGVKMLDICMETIGIIEITHQRVEKNQALKYVRALPETIEWIERKNEVTQYLRPVYEPMVVQPRDWEDPFSGGYISSNIKPLKLVKTKNRAYLDELRNVDMPIVYEAVNALQRTPWQINSGVLEVMKSLWESGSEMGGLPPREGLPMPKVPHDIETNELAKKEFRIASAKLHMQNLSILGQRIGFSIGLGIAGRFEKYRKIYFPYQLDFRGRIYAVPHLNPQGADFQKALLRFANGKPLGEEGWKWLAIHGANVAGFDKASLEDRVNWVQDNEEEIIRCANDPYNQRGWCTEVGGVSIDKPWQFLAFCIEWAGYCEHGEAFVSKLPVAMDGSCSGIQHFSAMLRDKVGGAAVNLVPQELPADVYQLVANKVIEQVKHDLVHGTEDGLGHTDEGLAYVIEGTKSLAAQWLQFGITRKVTKRSVMTLAYGSKEYGFKEQLMEDIIRPARQAAQMDPARFPFSHDGYRAAAYMAKAIWVAVNLTLVKASEAMNWLKHAASLAASEQLPVRWNTPVGFPVMQAYPDLALRTVKTAINGKTVKLTMYAELEKLDRRKQSQGIAPNYVHSCDAGHMMLTVVRAKQVGITNFAMIHDSFGTTAGDVEDLYHVVREAFVEMYEDIPVLENFRDEISNQLSDQNKLNLEPLPERGTLDLSKVCESRYCFA